MKNKLIDYPAYLDRRPQEIKQLLLDVASDKSPSANEAMNDLLVEAAEYIRLLETLLDIYVTYSWPQEYGKEWIKDWKRFAKKQKDLPSEFVKIVEENFWELLA